MWRKKPGKNVDGKRTKPPSKVELKDLGAAILKRYEHPKHWEKGDSTGKIHLRNMMVLRVEEIRLGGLGFVSVKEAQLNARAIRAWAEWMGLTTTNLQFDQRVDKAPYVFVPKHDWPKVLKLLQSL